MLKKILASCIFCFSLLATQAQTNATEAKAAYLLAEDSYGKGDYKTTLEFLRQAREALGGANCKILYLQIMATRELYAKDSSYNNPLLSLITEFEKSPDYADFNEEKSLEITKLKLLIKLELKAVSDRLVEIKLAKERRIDSMAKARTQTHKDAIINTVNFYRQFNITLEELDKAQPKWKVKKWIADQLSPTVALYHNPAYSFNTADFPFFTALTMNKSDNPYTILGVYVKDGKIIGYQKLITNLFYEQNGFKVAYDITVSGTSNWVNTYSNLFLLDPIITPFSIAGQTANRYLWTEGKYGLMIEEMHYPKGGGGVVKVVETYFYNPTEKETSSYHPAEK